MSQPILYLFTIGLARRGNVENVVQALKEKSIQCAVDVRERQSAEGELGQNRLRTHLKETGIIYMSFLNEFGRAEERARKKDGKINYEKACKDGCFVSGIERLMEGLRKGYRIALLGLEAEPQDSFRYLAIGRKMAELGTQVWHIMPDNHVVSQSELNEKKLQQHIWTKRRADMAAEVGQRGEDIAATYLENNGYGILDRNWNLHRGCELDIVAHRDGIVHIVEVKTRNDSEGISPELAINQEKIKHLVKATIAYKKQNLRSNIPCQIDSIAVILKEGNAHELRFYENICNLGTF
ncbi:MAG: YraN family protein [Bacteroidaceae bacterium]|nr:YraN family protein [Bacteroidaceae bacterium]